MTESVSCTVSKGSYIMSHLDKIEPIFERALINAQNVSFHEEGPCVNIKKYLPHTAIVGLS